jgi:hypothetical protein
VQTDNIYANIIPNIENYIPLSALQYAILLQRENYNIKKSTIMTKKVKETIVKAYVGIESGVVNGYKKVESGVVGAYKKIESSAVNFGNSLVEEYDKQQKKK